MDLNVKALLSATYLIPIAITLRKIYAPSFEIPEAIAAACARVDARQRLTRAKPVDAAVKELTPVC